MRQCLGVASLCQPDKNLLIALRFLSEIPKGLLNEWNLR